MATDTDAFPQLSGADLAALGRLGVRRAVAAGEYLYMTLRFHLDHVQPSAEGNGILNHCRQVARALVAALRDLKVTKPEDVAGLP